MNDYNLKLATATALLRMATETRDTTDARHFAMSGLIHASNAEGMAKSADQLATAIELRRKLTIAVHEIHADIIVKTQERTKEMTVVAIASAIPKPEPAPPSFVVVKGRTNIQAANTTNDDTNYPWAAFDHDGDLQVDPIDNFAHPAFYLNALREHLETITEHKSWAEEKVQAIEQYEAKLEEAISDTEEVVADRETAERDERDKYDEYSDEMF